MTMGPNSRRVSEVSKVVRVFLQKKDLLISNQFVDKKNLLNIVETFHPFAYIVSQLAV